MPKLSLTYFDFDGGRGEPARIALGLGNIVFEDIRLPVAEWPSLKHQYPFHQVPVLEVDGQALSQSNSINRYVAKLAGLYPADDWQAALCDEVMDAVDDVVQLVVNTFFLSDDEKKSKREALVADELPLYLQQMARRLNANGGEYFADRRLTIADLKVLIWIKGLLQGHLDYIPVGLVAKHAPDLLSHAERIENEIAA